MTVELYKDNSPNIVLRRLLELDINKIEISEKTATINNEITNFEKKLNY